MKKYIKPALESIEIYLEHTSLCASKEKADIYMFLEDEEVDSDEIQ